MGDGLVDRDEVSLMKDVKSLIEPYKEYVQLLRREFHEHPELSNREFETTKRIARELDVLGVEYELDTARNVGLVGIIKGDKPGKTIALRADIDALPVEERTNLPFKSKNEGVMHACGHDGHMAILLGAAKMLMENRDQLEGTVYLVFQPAEETGAGAPDMIAFSDWYEKTDAIFGGHVWSALDAGLISVEEGPRFAGSDIFTIKIQGKQAHGAQPQMGVDALVVAAAMVMNLQTIISRNISALDSAVLTIGNIKSGTEWNIVNGEATMGGTVRYFDKADRDFIVDRMKAIVEHTALAYGATAELIYEKRVPPTINETQSSGLAERVVVDVLGKEHLSPFQKVMAGEDFANYLEGKPGCFAFIGVRNPECDAVYDHHNNKFNMDDSVLSAASAVYAQYAIQWLKENK